MPDRFDRRRATKIPRLSKASCRQLLVIAVLGLVLGSGPAAAEGLTGQLEIIDVPAAAGALAPRLAVDPTDDTLLLSWLEPEADGHALRFSRYVDGRFEAPRTIASGTGWFVNWADTPGLHPAPGGHWIAHWLQKSGPATYAYDIRIAQSVDRGQNWMPLPSPHRDGTQTEHGFVSHFIDAGGDLHLVWLDGRYTGGGHHDHDHDHHDHGAAQGAMTLRSTRIGRDGVVDPSIELDDRVCDCCPTASAATAQGPVVFYRDRGVDEVRDIAVVRKIDGRWTEPRPVHADGWVIAGCPVNGPSVAADGNTVAAAWFTLADDGRPRVRIAFSADAGASFSAPQEFSLGTAIGRVDLVRHGPGWALSWMEQRDGGEAGLLLGEFGRDGTVLSHRALTRLDGGRISGLPRLASMGEELMIVWTDRVADADGPLRTRVHAAILESDPAPDLTGP